MFVEDYQPENIKPNIVDHEGEYNLRVENVEFGRIEAKNPGEAEKRYYRADCIIAFNGYPHVSIFLTEGPRFSAEATAFFDTFGIPRGNWNIETWRGHEGRMKIELRKKGEYTNMVPRYLLGPDGYVQKNVPQQQMQQSYNASPMQQQNYGAPDEGTLGDIPF